MSENLNQLRWWQRGVIYQIYPRSFMDASGEGVGDLAGIIHKLDHLNDGTAGSLGVDAVWLSPFYPSPMADFGYDVADYCDVDPLFGDLGTFDTLVEACHRRDMKVIIDWVPNHTSDQHPWFLESRRSREAPRRDWYIWRDAKPDGSPPNNWGSFFGGPAWTFDEHTRQYYLHQFVKEQPDLNWRNPQVKEAMLDTLRFWLHRGVDGFRMDVIGLIHKDPELRDNPLDPNAPADLKPNDLHRRQLHVYNMDQDDVHLVIQEIRGVLDEFDDRVAIGELWGPLDRWVRYYGTHGEELHLPFNFRLMAQPWSAAAMRKSVDEMEACLPGFAWPNYVLGNHDQMRLVTRFGGQAQARVAAMMLLTLRGTPTLYYGDEIGLENGVILPHQVQDPQGVNLGVERTRDVCRTPMQWDSGPYAGFSTHEPWLPVSADYTTRNVAVQADDPLSLYNLYRMLLQQRRLSPALNGGSYRSLDTGQDTFVYLRQAGEDLWLVALNFTDQALQLDLTGLVSNLPPLANLVLSTHLDRFESVDLSGLSLRPYEGVLVAL